MCIPLRTWSDIATSIIWRRDLTSIWLWNQQGLLVTALPWISVCHLFFTRRLRCWKWWWDALSYRTAYKSGHRGCIPCDFGYRLTWWSAAFDGLARLPRGEHDLANSLSLFTAPRSKDKLPQCQRPCGPSSLCWSMSRNAAVTSLAPSSGGSEDGLNG
jgi:hypothetical protein